MDMKYHQIEVERAVEVWAHLPIKGQRGLSPQDPVPRDLIRESNARVMTMILHDLRVGKSDDRAVVESGGALAPALPRTRLQLFTSGVLPRRSLALENESNRNCDDAWPANHTRRLVIRCGRGPYFRTRRRLFPPRGFRPQTWLGKPFLALARFHVSWDSHNKNSSLLLLICTARNGQPDQRCAFPSIHLLRGGCEANDLPVPRPASMDASWHGAGFVCHLGRKNVDDDAHVELNIGQ